MISKYDKPEQFSNARVISAVGTTATPGRKVNVSIQIEASGDENGVGLTIGYDAAKLGNPVVTTGKDMPFASPLVNIFIIDISGTSSNGVSVSGTVVSSSGMPISNVTIVLTDRSGIARSTNSNPFGFFQMQNIPTGMVYTLSATSKRYSFPTSTVVMNADLVGIDLVADP
ncbi:MAG: carboxypeptidase regulatory-like domain-containing protein [Chloracidobacterium sp.]|nr:carboxypeptidase regulatory-like domain-containing protein [Chloracidobacterium sp.]